MPNRAFPGLLVLGGAMLVASACSNDSSGNTDAAEQALQDRVCTQADLGPDYREETAGDFSLSNLADLASNAGQRQRDLQAAGLKDGYFAYWKHNVGNPPFAPPNEVVCQVMEFGTEAQAVAFVAAMKPTPEELVTTALAWIPDSDRRVTAEPQPGPGSNMPARAFHLTASDSNVSVSLYAIVTFSGHYVQTIYTGGQDSNVTEASAQDIARTIATRLGD